MGYAAWRPEVKGNEHVVEVDGGDFWSRRGRVELPVKHELEVMLVP